jgi:hypothetical protein
MKRFLTNVVLIVPGMLLAGLGSPLSSRAGRAAEPTSAKQSSPVRSAAWWRDAAARYADKIADADSRGRARQQLTYIQVRTGDVENARATAAKIGNPQLRIYSHCFVARDCKRRGDVKTCRSELQQARDVALQSGKHWFELSDAYVEFGWPEDAIAYAAAYSDAWQRNNAFQHVVATLAKHGKLEMACDVIEQHVPPAWKEADLLAAADACAASMKIEDAGKLIEKLTNAKYRDQAYTNLADALLRANRCKEATICIDRISNPTARAAVNARFTAADIQGRSVESLRAKADKTTEREEKLAIYDLLLDKLVKAKDVAAAEDVIASMIATVQASPRKPEPSKFGTCDDTVVIALKKSNYLKIAGVLASQGDRKAALHHIVKAKEAIVTMPESAGLGKLMLVLTLVKTEVAVNDYDGARNTLDRLKGGNNCFVAMAAAEVAVGLIRSGNVKAGCEVAEEIVNKPNNQHWRGSVVNALIQAGELTAAKKMLQATSDGMMGTNVFEEAARTMIESNHAAELRQWLGELRSDAASAHVCIGAANALLKSEK